MFDLYTTPRAHAVLAETLAVQTLHGLGWPMGLSGSCLFGVWGVGGVAGVAAV